MSLSLRLNIIILLGFAFILALSINATLNTAQQQINSAFLDHSATVSLFMEVENISFSDNLNVYKLQFGQIEFQKKLEQLDHLKLQFHSSTRASPAEIWPGFSLLFENIQAPAWFVSYVLPNSMEPLLSIEVENNEQLTIWYDPGSQIETIWQQHKSTLIMYVSLCLLFPLLIFTLIRRWMLPSAAIIAALAEVEKGDFSRRVASSTLPELNKMTESINRLTSILGASQLENERLTRTSLNIQEQERRHMAQELHDSLGQSVSAIKAIAVSITHQLKGVDSVILTSANKIEEIADSAYNSVRAMMSSLRPSVLDELGLSPALMNMVDDWNEQHEDAFCRLKIDGDFNQLEENQSINIYRIIQEGLTNIAKHANAENVTVILSGREVISLSIIDDGQGYDSARVEKGMGLMGLRERVQALSGALTTTSRLRQGVNIQIEFPRLVSHRRRKSDS